MLQDIISGGWFRDKKMELLRRLSEKNLNLDKFDVYEPSLNDIFVEYTEDSI
jgi:ABC-type uncharacterized transport system ATPase subunit